MTTTLVIAGMPASGKTTFIAALRYCLNNVDMKAPSLILDGFSGDEKHLNMLEEKWLNCEEVDRTKKPTEAWVSLSVRDPMSNTAAELNLPDLRGELFEHPATMGQCETELLAAIEKADGLALFTNADRENDDMLIGDIPFMVNDETQVGQVGAEDAKSFDSKDMPEEAKIVELLQMTNRRPRKAVRRKLAVIISGWDAIDIDIDPSEWWSLNKPMAAQFLENNVDLWDYVVYGVSAQGGSLPADRERLKSIELPSERIIIAGNGAKEHDISAPIHWLLQRASS